jgi:hypothetical protein
MMKKASLALFVAGTVLLQLLAVCGNLEAVSFDGKAQALADFGFKLLELVAFEFHDLVTVLANDVIVMGMLGVIGIVELIIFAKVHFPDQPALRQQRQRAINRRAGNRLIPATRPGQQLLSGEMPAGAEGGIDDGSTLRGQPQVLAYQEIHKALLRALGACVCHGGTIGSEAGASQRGWRNGEAAGRPTTRGLRPVRWRFLPRPRKS